MAGVTNQGLAVATGRVERASVALDDSQRAVLALEPGQSAAVLGAPGSGKTTTLVEVIAHRVLVDGWPPESVLALTTSRSTATRLRDVLAKRLAVPSNGPLARTVNSLAFDVVTRAARHAGAPVPTLVTGADQDSDIAQLLEGQIADGTDSAWPHPLTPDVRRLRSFRTELREIMMRATEYGITPEMLADLAARHGRAEWAAVAAFTEEYLAVVSTSRSTQFDSAELSGFAVVALAGDVPLPGIDALRLIVVDDLQEATESALAVIRALAARGIAIVAFGDPDVATNSFRGGAVDALGRFPIVFDLPHARQLALGAVYRHSPALRQLVTAVTSKIGAAAAGVHRGAGAVGESDEKPVVRIEADTPARQWAAISRHLRERHLFDGVAWRQTAVVVRSGALVPIVARALALSDVPTRTSAAGRPLRDDRGARSLLTVIDVGSGRTPLDAQIADELLLGPYGGLDKLALRRLALALRAEELAGGGNRSSHELLVDALGDPARLATIDFRGARNALRLATILHRVRDLAAQGASAEELLWEAWDASGLARSLHHQAAGSGITATEANRHLDGVVALFSAAKRFVERHPGSPASVFLDGVLDADIPEDTLSPQSTDDAVLVTTPASLVGREFDVVIIAALQEGVWPNFRLRGSLLGPADLVRAATGESGEIIDARRQVLGDELRMFALAASRARRQVVLAAISNDDESPSVLFRLGGPTPTSRATAVTPLTLRGLTGRLRRDVVSARTTDVQRTEAATALARLAAEGVPGADPSEWHGLASPSTSEPVYLPLESVPISPSRVERFEKSPVDWFIETIAGSESSPSMALGTILHWAMETATDPSVDALWAAVNERWSEMLYEAPWLAEQQRAMARRLVGGIAEYLVDFEAAGKHLVAAEKTFEFELGQARVRGAIDRIERARDGSIVIVDLKTGNPITSQREIDEHPQLGAYQLALDVGALDDHVDGEPVRSGGAKLLFVKKGVRGKNYREGVQRPFDGDALEAFRTRILQAAAGMAAAQFVGALEVNERPGYTAALTLHRVPAVSSDSADPSGELAR